MALTQLAAALPVDVMPGEADPATAALPQQPMHRCLFPAAACYSSFRPATNPHEFALSGVRFLGSSGQNVDDVYKCVQLGRTPTGFSCKRAAQEEQLHPCFQKLRGAESQSIS